MGLELSQKLIVESSASRLAACGPLTLSLGSASHSKVSVSAIDTPNPDRHSGMLLAGIQPHSTPV
jgi:hypothetical protein